MPGANIRTFSDPQAYQAAIRAAEVQILPTQRGEFRAKLTKITLNRLWMQRGRESLPRVFQGAVKTHRAAIGFLVAAQPAMRHCGMDVSPGEIIVDDWQSMHRRTFAPCQWSSMSLSPEDLAAAGQAIAGRPLAAPSGTHVVRPDGVTMARLLNPLEEVVHLAETTPEKLSHPEVTRALEQTLIHAMVSCLTAGTVKEMSDGDRRHLAAIDRLEQFLESNHDRPVYIAEVCAACGVSERTLRASCQDHLGMSPVRYLWLRRMHLAHRMLIKADPTKTTVTEIATEHGFWELGRFSVQYRALFGELPSATLRRANSDRESPQNRPSALPIPNLHSWRH